MRRKKRVWIYAGLGVPKGAALVRRVAALPVRADSRRALLMGQLEVQGLVAPMARLAADSGATLRVDTRAGTAAEWSQSKRLEHHLSIFDPTVVFLVADPRDEVSVFRIRRKMQEHPAAALFWLIPPQVRAAPHPRFIPARNLTAAGYAAWAGQAWRMVK
jgi:hypothetical protein